MTAVVVGLDLSLAATGIALPDGTVQTVVSKGKADATLRQRAVRLHNLASDIILAIYGAAATGVDRLVVIEGPSLGQKAQRGDHERAGLWWAVVDALDGEPGVDVVDVPPALLKKYATGKGNAPKDAVQIAAVRRYPDVDVSNNNEADALVLRAMGCDQLGQPLAVVPQTHRAALDKVAWPDFARSDR